MSTYSVVPDMTRLQLALESAKCTAGTTHGFYLYPARFSPETARTVIEMFSRRGDWVMDPFMGGGTAIVEGVPLGRQMIGVDVNALAHFVSTVKTRPLSKLDEQRIRAWARRTTMRRIHPMSQPLPRVRNLPATVKGFLFEALLQAERLPMRRQKAFARSVLLRLGQWAIDCTDHALRDQATLNKKLPELTEEMLIGLQQFVDECRNTGLNKNEIAKRRVLLCRDIVGLPNDARFLQLGAQPRLVFTSPPYPGVHVLYHRWQVSGRKETPAPYWIADVPDGSFASHYAGGSRTPTGERNYFAMIRSAFTSVRAVLSYDAIVIQLVGFSDMRVQLPQYLRAMSEAGFELWKPPEWPHPYISRCVPNRKWYTRLQRSGDSSSEFLLFHRPSLFQ